MTATDRSPTAFIACDRLHRALDVARFEWGFWRVGPDTVQAPDGRILRIVTQGERLFGVAWGSPILLAPYWQNMDGYRLIDEMLRLGRLLETPPEAFKSPAKSPESERATGRNA